MADIRTLSELLQENAYLQGGGDLEGQKTTDKVGNIVTGLRQGVLDISTIRTQAVETALKKKQIELAGKKDVRDQEIFNQEYAFPVPLPEGVQGPQEEPTSLYKKSKEADIGYKQSETEKNRLGPKGGIHRIIHKKTGQVLSEYPSTPGTGDTITLVGEDTDKDKEDKVQSRKDEASRQAVNVIKNYYSSVRNIQGKEDVGLGSSLGIGIQGLTSRIPAVGRALQPETSQVTGFRTSQGARLAKSFGDSGNIALQEQKNALELLAPPGTRNLDLAEKQALATALEGIKNRTPEEEAMYQEVKKSFELGAEQPKETTAVPRIGENFNGEKVIGVRKIK